MPSSLREVGRHPSCLIEPSRATGSSLAAGSSPTGKRRPYIPWCEHLVSGVFYVSVRRRCGSDSRSSWPMCSSKSPPQVVLLRPEDWLAWLHLTKTEAELLRPLPRGSLDVATVREGSR
jgi:hypothetical protein